MNFNNLKKILKNVEKGNVSVEEAANLIKVVSVENLDFARIDHHRNLRKGFP